MDEDVNTVEAFERFWTKTDKGVVCEHIVGKNRAFLLLFEVKTIRVSLAIIIGPRGGLRAEIVAIDTSKKIVSDRLVVNYEGEESGIIDLYSVREFLRDEDQPMLVAQSELKLAAITAISNPADFISRLHTLDRSSGISVLALRGGAPGLRQQS